MALLFNFLFGSVLLYSASLCLPIQPVQDDVYSIIKTPAWLCPIAYNEVFGRKIIFCLICKGFDPSCFHTTTTSTTTTTTSTTSSTSSEKPTTTTTTEAQE